MRHRHVHVFLWGTVYRLHQLLKAVCDPKMLNLDLGEIDQPFSSGLINPNWRSYGLIARDSNS